MTHQRPTLPNCEELVGDQPSPHALLTQGLALHRQGSLSAALECYGRLLGQEPGHGPALKLMAELHLQAKRYQDALDLLDRLLELHRQDATAFNNRGIALSALGRMDEALQSYAQALRIDPGYAEAHYNRGNAQMRLARAEEALSSFEQAVRLRPGFAQACHNRGVALEQLGRREEALAAYLQAVAAQPDYGQAHLCAGRIHAEAKRFELALACFTEALRSEPQHAEAHNLRGLALQSLQRFEDALASHTRATQIQPGYGEAHYNRGLALSALKRFDEARQSFERARDLMPGFADAYLNLGNSLEDLRRFEQALATYDEALRVQPGYAEALNNRALLRLSLQRFPEGFSDYRHRWQSKAFAGQHLRTTLPSCRPGNFQGKVLLWAEQGLGDEIFFAGLIRHARRPGIRLTLSADRRLHPIFRRAFPEVRLLDRAMLMGTGVNEGYDAQAPIGDLAHLLQLDAAELAADRGPYLTANPQRKHRLMASMPVFEAPLVCGLAWQSANRQLGAEKSLRLQDLGDLLQSPGIGVVNLQYGAVADEIAAAERQFGARIHQAEELDVFHDIEGLLALIDACDVVVTASNVTAHLAGALGKKAAVLVPHGRGRLWYWHLDEERSFWYPSLRLFRQRDPRNWHAPVQDCVQWATHQA